MKSGFLAAVSSKLSIVYFLSFLASSLFFFKKIGKLLFFLTVFAYDQVITTVSILSYAYPVTGKTEGSNDVLFRLSLMAIKRKGDGEEGMLC